MYRDRIRERDGYWRRKDYYKDKRSLYVPQRNCDSESKRSRMEVMLEKLIKGLESQENFLKEIRVHILGLNQKVKSHATAIKLHEKQFRQMSTTLNQCQSGTLPSNTIQNPKNDCHYLAITTRSGKDTINPPISVVDDVRNNSVDVEDVNETKIERPVTNGKASNNPIVVEE